MLFYGPHVPICHTTQDWKRNIIAKTANNTANIIFITKALMQVEQVSQSKYLGSWISDNEYTTKDIRTGIAVDKKISWTEVTNEEVFIRANETRRILKAIWHIKHR